MEKEYWQEIDELFHRVVDLSPEQRSEVYRAEKISEALRHDVENLIASDPETEDRHLEMIQGEVGRVEREEFELNRVGERIGDYELIRELGRGGQGAVYLARRHDGELRGHVAIKILRTGLAARYSHQRFRQERHILSGLDHPNIARFLDAGKTPDGLLYLVLEAVEGQRIDRYCESHDLDLNGRLDLFCRAAGAVQAAHRQLIIHRDLKAGNILVTAEGSPKLLDFGIAKWLVPGHSFAETAPGVQHLTPEAASPEQVRGESLTTATDIYSLGLLLYRLLTSHSAYAFKHGSPSEIERVVCHEEPKLPSLAAGSSELRGDLDAIVFQALRKNPEERYPSVDAMVEDIRRYQRREPIRARSAGFFYRSGKFIRRHYRPILSLLFVAVALIYFIVQLSLERDKALEHLRIAESTERMLLGLFKETGERGTDTIPEQMAASLPLLDERPEFKADTMSVLGLSYHALDRHQDAKNMIQGALDIRHRLGPGQNGLLAIDLFQLGIIYLDTGHHEEARDLFGRARALAIKTEGESSWLAAASLARIAHADYELGSFDAAMEGAEEALRLFERHLRGGTPDPSQAKDLANAFDTKAGVHFQKKDYREAEAIYRPAIAMLQEALGSDHLDVGSLWNNLGMVLRRQKRFDEAVAAFLEAIRIDNRAAETHSIRLAIRQANLANTYRIMGQPQVALEKCHEALRMTLRVGGADHGNIPRIERCVELAEKALSELGQSPED